MSDVWECSEGECATDHPAISSRSDSAEPETSGTEAGEDRSGTPHHVEHDELHVPAVAESPDPVPRRRRQVPLEVTQTQKHNLIEPRTYSLRVKKGHRTSIRLETTLWEAFQDIAASEGLKVHDIAALIFAHVPAERTFTSAVRVFIASYLYNWAKINRWPPKFDLTREKLPSARIRSIIQSCFHPQDEGADTPHAPGYESPVNSESVWAEVPQPQS